MEAVSSNTDVSNSWGSHCEDEGWTCPKWNDKFETYRTVDTSGTIICGFRWVKRQLLEYHQSEWHVTHRYTVNSELIHSSWEKASAVGFDRIWIMLRHPTSRKIYGLLQVWVYLRVDCSRLDINFDNSGLSPVYRMINTSPVNNIAAPRIETANQPFWMWSYIW